MKKLKYIYTLLIAMLLGIVSFACSDDEEMEQDKKENDATDVRSGRFVTTTITVSAAAPALSVGLEGTRAGNDQANIDHDQTENGGRFQNIVVVVTNDKDSVYAIHCNKWYGDRPTSTGVKQYEVIFPDVQIYTTDGNKAKVYAFGNVDIDRWNTINGYTVEATRKKIEEYAEINNLLIAKLSVDDADLYSLSFVPESGNYKVGGDKVTKKCTGMPVNGTADAEVKKGATKFSVHMRRVCARLEVTFRNFTGQYKDYESKENLPNNIYVDEFVIKKILAKSTNYFHDSVAKGNNYTPSETGTVDFNILEALGGSKKNDHDINKIENGDDLVVSMYVFENKKGTGDAYTYDLKVDRGKNLGLKTTVIDPENAYVIWNNQAQHSIALKNKIICSSDEQKDADRIPFDDQVFWQIESAPSAKLDRTYVLNHCKYDKSTDIVTPENKYLQQQPEPTDWGVHFYCSQHNKSIEWYSIILHITHLNKISYTVVDEEFNHAFEKTPIDISKAQYINFVLDPTANDEQSRFTFNLLRASDKTKNQNYWEETSGYKRFLFLTVNEENKQLNCERGTAYNKDGTLGNFDWTLYAKYIIKKGNKFGEGKDGNVTQYPKITRNSSYSMDFSVMPNYEKKQELLVNCVRDQKTISWESVDK